MCTAQHSAAQHSRVWHGIAQHSTAHLAKSTTAGTPTVRCKEGALACEGVADAADGLPAFAQLAKIPDRHAVVTAGCGKQLLVHRLHLQAQSSD